MGNRVKGRTKRKSVKAALSSTAGSKRKLTRMGKKQKKEHGGLEATFIGRSKCIKMLQVTIKDFRRLCILKGIYPRDPVGRTPGKKKGQSFYHIKDIKAIAHEPILQKFREFRAFMKKVRRAAGRNERDEAQRKNSLLPQYSLHHLVKERYPRFIDALSDLDDALTLTYLFAALPSHSNVSAKVIQKAKTLAAAWGAYCATTSCITKSFISVKGVYLEASILPESTTTPVRWIVPHAFTQYLPPDVDFRVMGTFLEFYDTLLNFVLYKLYNDIGVRYPFPKQVLVGSVGNTSAVLAKTLRALMEGLDSKDGAVSKAVTETLKEETSASSSNERKKASTKHNQELVQSVEAVLNRLQDKDDNGEEDNDSDAEDDVDVSGPLRAALDNVADEEARGITVPNSTSGDGVDDETIKRRRLFQGLTFFFSREVPRGYLEVICLSFGGKVGWEADDSPIDAKDPSITHHVCDRPKAPSGSLPTSREFIQPQWILDCSNFMILLPIERYAVGATLPPHLSPWVDNEEEGYKPAYAEEIERLKNGEPMTLIESEEAMEAEEERRETKSVGNEEAAMIEQDVDDEESADDDEEEEESKRKEDRKAKKQRKEEEEAHALAKTMMGKKASHLYNRMQHGLAGKKAKVEELQKRRKEIETTRKKDGDGKTVLKQKVERLKEERKSLEDQYEASSGSMKKRKKHRKSG